jgi:hypothetical protein
MYKVLLVMLLGLLICKGFSYQTFNDQYTDSLGRTALYRYFLEDDHDVNAPAGVLVYFHGNNSGTQTEVIDMFSYMIRTLAFNQGLVPVLIASPQTRSDGVTRQWMDQDIPLLHNLLQSQFEGNLNVNLNQVILYGASQGTCFLNDFIPAHGDSYGGGYIGACGCFNSPELNWQPSPAMKENFRVYIHGTTDDFLYEPTVRSFDFYKHVIGLTTYGDLDLPGGHCSETNTMHATALEWVLGESPLPEPSFAPFWERVFVDSNIVALSSTAPGELWAGIYKQTQSEFWRSIDYGNTFTLRGSLNGELLDMEISTEGTLLASIRNNGEYTSPTPVLNFTDINSTSVAAYMRIGDTLWRKSTHLEWALSPTGPWNQELSQAYSFENSKHNFGIRNPQSYNNLIARNSSYQYVIRQGSLNFELLNIPTGDRINSISTYNNKISAAVTFYDTGVTTLYFKDDILNAWSTLLPQSGTLNLNGLYQYSLATSFLPNGELYAFGSWSDLAFRSSNDGSSWQRLPGFVGISGGNFAEDPSGFLYAGNSKFILRNRTTEQAPVPNNFSKSLYTTQTNHHLNYLNGFFIVRLSQSEPFTVRLLDIRGKEVLRFAGYSHPGGTQHAPDLAGLAPGYYTAVLSTQGKVLNQIPYRHLSNF